MIIYPGNTPPASNPYVLDFHYLPGPEQHYSFVNKQTPTENRGVTDGTNVGAVVVQTEGDDGMVQQDVAFNALDLCRTFLETTPLSEGREEAFEVFSQSYPTAEAFASACLTTA